MLKRVIELHCEVQGEAADWRRKYHAAAEAAALRSPAAADTTEGFRLPSALAPRPQLQRMNGGEAQSAEPVGGQKAAAVQGCT